MVVWVIVRGAILIYQHLCQSNGFIEARQRAYRTLIDCAAIEEGVSMVARRRM